MDSRLLIVDARAEFSDAARDHLMQAAPGWSLTHAPSVDDARLVCDTACFDALVVVVTLGDEGVAELLSFMRDAQPDCVRLVLADVHTLEATQDLVSLCHRVLVAPCEPDALEAAIEHTRRLQETLGKTGLRVLGQRRRFKDSRRPTGDLLSTV